jgi:hypothetical protein
MFSQRVLQYSVEGIPRVLRDAGFIKHLYGGSRA